MRNGWLILAGSLSAAASLLHLGCILGGPSWYRFFGAGEKFARMAENGSIQPAIITVGIAGVLAVWAAYAFSGAGLIPRLPFLRLILVAITAVYLLRAAALPLMLGVVPGRSDAFMIWSSAVVLVFGLVHALGVWRGWSDLGAR
jgi:hypothetical protein